MGSPRRAVCGTRGSLRTMHGGGSAPSCFAFTLRVAFEEGSGPRVLLKSALPSLGWPQGKLLDLLPSQLLEPHRTPHAVTLPLAVSVFGVPSYSGFS